MALDGLTIAALRKELADFLTEGRIQKIVQTEKDELFFTIKTAEDLGRGRQVKLYLSAQASLPLAYLCEETKAAPPAAPSFCMLLRKHLQNGRIVSVSQPGLERVLRFEVEHRNEMGDLCRKTLLIELMGKYSNIIFLDENNRILDAIRRVPASVSSVREVLPGKDYFIPSTQDKKNPLEADAATFSEYLRFKAQPVFQALYNSYTGLSPILAQEICFRSQIDPDLPVSEIGNEQILSLFRAMEKGILEVVRSGDFHPEILYENGAPKEFSAVPLTLFGNMEKERMCSISAVLLTFYAKKNAAIRIRQKSSELRHVIQVHLERATKKYDLQMQQWKDTEKREKFRLQGELLTAYAYQITDGLKEVELLDYHTDQMVKVRLDPARSVSENAQRLYEKYNKMKRTAEKLSILTEETKEEVEHLKSIQASLNLAENEADLMQIRREMIASSYLRGSTREREEMSRSQGVFIPARGNISNKKKASAKAMKGSGKGGTPSGRNRRKEGAPGGESQPLHFVSEDGFDLYVGKNNYQNDQVTFHIADREDWWFHAKKIPGSHVILKSGGRKVTDRAFEEAASLAAYYSSGRDQKKVEVDYLQQKNVKKPSGAKPGFVVYYTNYSMVAETDLTGLKQV